MGERAVIRAGEPLPDWWWQRLGESQSDWYRRVERGGQEPTRAEDQERDRD